MNVLFLDDEKYRYDYLVLKPIHLNNLRGMDGEVELIWVKTFEEFCKVFPTQKWDLISLDHDLCDFQQVDGRQVEYTGYSVAKWLLEYHSPRFAASNILEDTLVNIHTMNFIRGKEMYLSLDESGIYASLIDFGRLMAL
jgi:hypothetical protein